MTAGDLKQAVLERAGELNPANDTAVFFTEDEALAAINSAQSIFSFTTLCIEDEMALPLEPNVYSYTLLDLDPALIVPLAVRRQEDKKRVRPSTLAELDARDKSWKTKVGSAVERYANVGFDRFFIYRMLDHEASLTIAYARTAATMDEDADVPEIFEEYHSALADGAVALMRVPKEGDGEISKVIPLFKRYLDAIGECGARMRVRNAGYDRQPMELERMDLSKLLKPSRRAARPEAISN